MTMDGVNPAAKTIPESLFMLYQMTFAIITVALVAGPVADRMRFSAYLLFSIGWFNVRLRSARTLGLGRAASSAPRAYWILPAASSCISAPGSAAWLQPK